MSTDLKLIPRPSNDHYELTEDFNVTVVDQDIWIPKGFHYDGASIPAPAWPLTYTPFAPDVMRAAIVHDWLYHAHEDAHDEHSPLRKATDEIFFQLLLGDKVSAGKAKVMWAAVRTFGGVAWGNDEEDRDVVRNVYRQHVGEPDIGKFRFPTWAVP
jgi:hypothetical protein